MSDKPQTFWRRLGHTPMRDWLRGRLTGRLDLDALLDAAELPQAARDVVRRTVKRTRLWRLEKVGVAQELIAHFHDGLEAGHTPEALIESFGDEKQAAKLIRRGKIRNRPLVWHAMRWFRRGVGVLFALYFVAWLWLITGEPNPQIDYVAQINEASVAAPESDAGWLIYRAAMIRFGFVNLDVEALETESADRGERMIAPGDPGWLDAVVWLEQHEELIDAIRAGAAKPALGLPIGFDWDYQGADRLALYGPDVPEVEPPGERADKALVLADGWLVGVLMPHLVELRRMNRIIRVDFRAAAEAGDAERAMTDFQTMLGLSRQAREHPLLINDLVGHIIFVRALREVGWLLHHQPEFWDHQQWIAVSHELAALDDYAYPQLSGERMFMLDLFQRIYDESGSVTYDGLRFLNRAVDSLSGLYMFDEEIRHGAAYVGLPVVAMLMADHEEMREAYDRLWRMMLEHQQKPMWEQIRTASGVEQQVNKWMMSWRDRARYWPMLNLMPALDAASRTTRQTIAARDALQAAIAAELYQREHGAYPSTLDDLVPRFLPELPVDHSTGKVLCYRAWADGVLVYGRGYDSDDDGGVMPADYNWPGVSATDEGGDWVLYPPPPEP